MTDETVKCKHCGATDVYWMTVMGRREAEFVSKVNKNPLVLKLAKAKLYNLGGGKHVCPIKDSFDVVPE
jgi:hypothetical protein